MGFLYRISATIFPKRFLLIAKNLQIIGHYLVFLIVFFGIKVKCPCCGGHFRNFFPYKRKNRSNAVCPGCGSLERHRLMVLFLKDKTNLFSEKTRILHVAPQLYLQLKFWFLFKDNYLTVDLCSPFVMQNMSITKMPLDDNAFDCVICNHVLEHVADDKKALSEILRVMKPGGWAILQAHMDPAMEKTLKVPEGMAEEERVELMGEKDHLRVYGQDYSSLLEDAGFVVRKEKYVMDFSEKELAKYGLKRDEDVYFCHKSRSS